jgi:hypothetical protein
MLAGLLLGALGHPGGVQSGASNWRRSAVFVGGLLLGLLGTAALFMPNKDEAARSTASSTPAATPAMPVAALPAPCDSYNAIIASTGDGDGQVALNKEAQGSATAVHNFIVKGKESAASGHLRDAETTFLNACRSAQRLKDDPVPLADAQYQLGRHYAQVAAVPGVPKRAEMLTRAEALYANALQSYRQHRGPEHEKTRFAGEGLAQVQQLVAAAGLPRVATAPAAPQAAPQGGANDTRVAGNAPSQPVQAPPVAVAPPVALPAPAPAPAVVAQSQPVPAPAPEIAAQPRPAPAPAPAVVAQPNPAPAPAPLPPPAIVAQPKPAPAPAPAAVAQPKPAPAPAPAPAVVAQPKPAPAPAPAPPVVAQPKPAPAPAPAVIAQAKPAPAPRVVAQPKPAPAPAVVAQAAPPAAPSGRNEQRTETRVAAITPRPEPRESTPGTPRRTSPSFDCRLARSVTERLICADEDLARQDRELGGMHQRAKQAAADPRAFQRQSDAEWRRREETCRDRECLQRWYAQRRVALAPGGAQGPATASRSATAPAAIPTAPRAAPPEVTVRTEPREERRVERPAPLPLESAAPVRSAPEPRFAAPAPLPAPEARVSEAPPRPPLAIPITRTLPPSGRPVPVIVPPPGSATASGTTGLGAGPGGYIPQADGSPNSSN